MGKDKKGVGYLPEAEIRAFNKTLSEAILHDTISFWVASRLNGASVTMCCDGNVSVPLVKAFDRIRDHIKKEEFYFGEMEGDE